MKRSVLAMLCLAVCVAFASCGRGDGGRENDAEEVLRPESGGGTPGSEERQETGNAPADNVTDPELAKKEMAADEDWTEGEALLSDKVLKAGETMGVFRFVDERTLEEVLEMTLQEAELTDSPEEAGLDRSWMEERTEIYDLTGNPTFCGIDEARLLTCNLTVKKVSREKKGKEQEDGLHISEIMIAYVDPTTRKVSLLSCMPVYFSASSSSVGKSDYYHYAIPDGESREMTVAWLVPKEYEAANLYLCVTYDAREPEERQYFRLFE